MRLGSLWTAATLVAALIAEAPASASALPERLTFEQALTRAYEARGLGNLPDDALRTLENPQRFDWPAVRVEGSWSDVRKIDIVHDSLLVSVDYPLLDGGARELRRRWSMLAAASFRERTREVADRVFEETVDAVARLYLAQERRRILQAGLDRASSMRRRADEMLLAREISNVTAAQWQDEAIVAETQLIDLELERLDAETRLKQLMGDTTSEPIEVVLDLNAPHPAFGHLLPARGEKGHPPASHVSLDLARAARRPQVMLSAFGGVASLPGEDRSGLFGFRMTLALPMFDAALRRREAEAQLELAAASFERKPLPVRRDRDLVVKRLELLTRAVDVAKERAASLARLTAAGLRSESALAAAVFDVGKRESAVLEARVELWRLTQLAR